MKKTFALLFATSLLASAPAFAWDPAAPARGVVDTFVDKCPQGRAVCAPFTGYRVEAQGWACSNPVTQGGDFDLRKLSIVAAVNNWVTVPPVFHLLQLQNRPDVVAAGACPISAVGFKVAIDYGSGPVSAYPMQLRFLYDGVMLDPNRFLIMGPR